jgi:hypothetical protein
VHPAYQLLAPGNQAHGQSSVHRGKGIREYERAGEDKNPKNARSEIRQRLK